MPSRSTDTEPAATSVKILSAYHKPYQLLESDVFVPIHVGREVAMLPAKDKIYAEADAQWLFDRMIGDDTGDNISSRNRNYCELTGIYWAWKNYDQLGNPDHIGFMQYRRHFIFADEVFSSYIPHNDDERAYSKINVGGIYDGYQQQFGLTDEKAREACSQFDLIIPKSCQLSHVGVRSIREDYTAYIEGTKGKDLDLLLSVVQKVAPGYHAVLVERLGRSDKRCFQSFVMRRDIFFEYCEFLFGILFEVDKVLDTSKYSVNGQRTLGYLGEILFDCFMSQKLIDQSLRIKELGMTFLCADSIPVSIKPKTAVVLLAYSDYESLELSLAAHARFLPEGMKLFILQNGRGSYDCERTYRVAKRYEALYPSSIVVVDDIPAQSPYHAIRHLLESDRMSEYAYICKVDDDTFPITADWLDRLCEAYEEYYAKHGNNLAYVTALVNNNPFGFKKLIEHVPALSEEYFARIAREHRVGMEGGRSTWYSPARIISASEIDDGISGTVWRYSYIARWIHQKTSLLPDSYIELTKDLPDAMVGNKRYSINCMLFKKDFWSKVYDPDCEFPTDDEFMCELYCTQNGLLVPARLSIPLVHLFFAVQREENKDMIDQFRAVYQDWLDIPYPIPLQSNREIENENRLRFMEQNNQAPRTVRAKLFSIERAKKSQPLRALWRRLPTGLKHRLSRVVKL